MTPEQELHLTEIINRFAKECDAKYRKGQAEHGGDLFKIPPKELLKNIMEEAIDAYVYAYTALDAIERAESGDEPYNPAYGYGI